MNKTYEELSDELHVCHERIAELEALVEQHRVAEEMQIKLREKADERAAALAAHIQDLAQKMDKWADDLDCLDSGAPDWGECMQIAGQIRVAWHYCDSVDKDALVRRDKIKQAEALEGIVQAIKTDARNEMHGYAMHLAANIAGKRADELRHEAGKC